MGIPRRSKEGPQTPPVLPVNSCDLDGTANALVAPMSNRGQHMYICTFFTTSVL